MASMTKTPHFDLADRAQIEALLARFVALLDELNS